MKSTHKQSGNILFIILIAVVLFAALSFALSSNLRSNENTGKEQSLIGTSELIQYANAVENAVMMLKVSKQCAVENISFESSPFDGSDSDYVNPNSPSDFSCHIFHPLGGKISPQSPPPDVNDGRPWAYIERTVLEIGADQTHCGAACNDLLIILGGLNETTCKTLNQKINGTPDIPVQAVGGHYDTSKFTGHFTASDYIGYGAAGHTRLCILDDFGEYTYYHVIMPR